MEEKDLTTKLSLFKEVKPRQDWAFSVKQSLLSGESKSRIMSQADIPQVVRPLHEGFGSRMITEAVSAFRYFTIEKPAFALASILLFMGAGVLFHASQSLPGDILYSLRSAGEEAQSRLDTPGDVPQLQVAQRRFADLKKVVEGNKSQNLSSAIRELEKSVSGASQELVKLAEQNPGETLTFPKRQALLIAGKEILELQKERVLLEETLGMTFGTEDTKSLNNVAKVVVEIELADLETRTLTDEQKEAFEEARGAYNEGRYDDALEKILFISQESVDH